MYDEERNYWALRTWNWQTTGSCRGLCLRAVRRSTQAAQSASTSAWMEIRGCNRCLRWSGSANDADLRFLGLFETLTPEALDRIEQFFLARGAEVMHEVFRLRVRQHSICYAREAIGLRDQQRVRSCGRSARSDPCGWHSRSRGRREKEAQLWSDINARGWTHEHPEFEDFVRESGVLVVAREGKPLFSRGNRRSARSMLVR